jgi:hypothetical protein
VQCCAEGKSHHKLRRDLPAEKLNDFAGLRCELVSGRDTVIGTHSLTVTRLADGAGVACSADTNYAAGRRWARQPIDVTIVAGPVQLSKDRKVIHIHPLRHDRSRDLGAVANPKGRPRRKNSATGNVA